MSGLEVAMAQEAFPGGGGENVIFPFATQTGEKQCISLMFGTNESYLRIVPDRS